MSIENGREVQTGALGPDFNKQAKNALEPNQFWTRTANHVGGCSCCTAKDTPGKVTGKDGSQNLYQFTGDGNKAGLPPVEVRGANHGAGCSCCAGKDASGKTNGKPTSTDSAKDTTYKVRKDDSLWTVASKLVDKSDCKDKSDKLKLDVVKGLVEKNKQQYKGLEANPDKVVPGQVLKIDSVKALAELGHGKKLNSHYKPEEKQEKSEKRAPGGEKVQRRVAEPAPRHTHRAEGEAGEPAVRLPTQRLERERPPVLRENSGAYVPERNPALLRQEHHQGQRQQADLGPMKDVLGMLGMIAGGALRSGFDNGNRHHHFGGRPRDFYEDRMPRGYHEVESSRGYYDSASRFDRYNGGYQSYQHPHQMRHQYRMAHAPRYEQPRPFFN